MAVGPNPLVVWTAFDTFDASGAGPGSLATADAVVLSAVFTVVSAWLFAGMTPDLYRDSLDRATSSPLGSLGNGLMAYVTIWLITFLLGISYVFTYVALVIAALAAVLATVGFAVGAMGAFGRVADSDTGALFGAAAVAGLAALNPLTSLVAGALFGSMGVGAIAATYYE